MVPLIFLNDTACLRTDKYVPVPPKEKRKCGRGDNVGSDPHQYKMQQSCILLQTGGAECDCQVTFPKAHKMLLLASRKSKTFRINLFQKCIRMYRNIKMVNNSVDKATNFMYITNTRQWKIFNTTMVY